MYGAKSIDREVGSNAPFTPFTHNLTVSFVLATEWGIELVGESASSHMGLPLTQNIWLYSAVPIECRNMKGKRLSKSASLFAINFIEN